MFNKFKNGQRVIVKGYGKKNGWFYSRRVGTVVCRDPYFLDYEVEFNNGTVDWFDEECITEIKKGRKKKC